MPAEPIDAGASGCGSDADCAAPAGRCDVATRGCVQCLGGVDCPSGACAAGVCLPFPDRCEVAQPLLLTGTPLVVESTTQMQTDDTELSCALGEDAPDLVYELIVTAASRVHVKVTPKEGSALRPVISIGTACSAAAGGVELGCQWAQNDGPAELSIDVAAGHVFLWVDADFGSAGPFVLEAFAEPVKPGDSCTAPAVMTFVDGEYSEVGDTTMYADDFAGSCGTSGGFGAPDRVYQLTLDKPQRLQVNVTPTTGSYRPLLYLRRPHSCASDAPSAQIDCGRFFPTKGAAVDLPKLDPGTYWLIVDGDGDESSAPTHGEYTLTAKLLPPLALATNDRCSGALPLVLPALGTTVVKGDTFSALGDSTSACGGSGPDVVYAYTLTKPRYVEARITPDVSSGFIPAAYLRSTCESELSSELVACNAASSSGGASVIAVGNLAAGTYFLWVDGLLQTRGSFVLEVTTKEPLWPPFNDTCATPKPLQPNLGAVAVSGTTLGANDDRFTCEVPYGAPSPDVVYSLAVPVQSSLSVDVQANQGSTLRPIINLSTACASSPTTELVCTWGDPSAPNRVVHTRGSIPPGTYYVWVDGDYTSSGAFTLKAELGPPVPPPANDGCASALPLPAAGGQATGDTRSAGDSSHGTCAQWQGGSGEISGDVVYTFTLATTRSVALQAMADATDGKLFRPVLYVRGPGSGTCASQDLADQRGCAVAAQIGGTASLSLPNLPAGTYSVWVDGAGKTTGKFVLSLSLQ